MKIEIHPHIHAAEGTTMADQHVDSTTVNDYIEMLKGERSFHRETLKVEKLTGGDYTYYEGFIAGLQDAIALAENYLRRPWNE